MATCSIVIPVFNRASVTRQCLRSLLEGPSQGRTDYEVIVVDDASNDRTQSVLAGYGDRLRVVRHSVNAGFAATCNDGAAIASGRYLVFLNNDTIPQAGWLDALVDYADARPGVAVVGSKLLFSDGTIQHAGVAIGLDRFPWHLYVGFPAYHPAVNISRRVPIVTGACMAIRREIFDEIEGFDTAFRNGYEDVDLCLRVSERGDEVHYCHRSVLYHLEAATREGRNAELDNNLRLYRERWFDRVVPNDFQYYADDRLLRGKYFGVYPFQLTVSPELATIRQPARELESQTSKLFELQRQVVRLSVRLQEAELQLREQTDAAWPASDQPRLISPGAPHALPTSTRESQLVSVVLIVKDCAAELEELLRCILEQRADARIEIISADLGSTDRTVDVLRQYKATVLGLDGAGPHGSVAQSIAAGFAQGWAVVYLSPSARPRDNQWLASLLAPLRSDVSTAGVTSRVVPTANADVLTRRDIEAQPSASSERGIRKITDWAAYWQMSDAQIQAFLSFNTVSAAIRRDVLNRIPLRTPELWAKDALEAGWSLQHEPSSEVCYSPAQSLVALLQQSMDDGRANRALLDGRATAPELEANIAEFVHRDVQALADRDTLSAAQLESFITRSAMLRSAQVLGGWLGRTQA